MTKTSKPRPQEKQEKPKERKAVSLYTIGVPKIFYRGSMFLAAKHVYPQLRTVYSKTFMSGTVDGALGQMHLDVLEAIFCNQIQLIKPNESNDNVKILGVVFDPYQVRKSLNWRMTNERIFHFINEIINCKINITFSPPQTDPSVVANTPLIIKMDSFKEVTSSKSKIKRDLKCIYVADWFALLSVIPPFSDHKAVFYNIKDPTEKAMCRYISSLENNYVNKLTKRAICLGAGLETSTKNIELAEVVRRTIC